MGPDEIFEIHMQNLFESWEIALEYGDFNEYDLSAFCSQTPHLWDIFQEFRFWRDF